MEPVNCASDVPLWARLLQVRVDYVADSVGKIRYRKQKDSDLSQVTQIESFVW